MTQKWNLQDIRPATPRPSRAPQPQGGMERIKVNRPGMTPGGSNDISPQTHHQSLPPREHHEPAQQEREPSFEGDHDNEQDERIPVINGGKRNRAQLIFGIAIVAMIIGGGLAVSILTGGAKVTIHPKVREMNVNAEYTAYAEKKSGELSYEIMTLDASGERQVKATGQSTVTKQATGEIEISKSTAGTERLIKNTRFQTADGLIYRIQESVVVPGAGKDASGNLVPGSIRAQVFADEVGEKYNIPASTKLMVPGFKEGGYTELYNAISATNGQAFTDGYNGPKFIINDDELSTARQSLQLELRNSLLEKVKAERPANFTTFDSAIAITYSQLPPTQYGDNLVTIKEQAILQIPLFQKDDFASFIAKGTITGYEGEPVRIDNLQNLNFVYTDATTSQSNIANEKELHFKITGVPRIVWTFDSEKMKTELLGMAKTGFNGVLAQYTGIERGEVEIRPFWKRSFPINLKDITITEDLSTAK
ncbi:hypothetical protein H7100_00565 [Candidatus Saccharibacteria bacterium]|nr:hypothetical protein [Candidatus Saccharibacteria bacterium]